MPPRQHSIGQKIRRALLHRVLDSAGPAAVRRLFDLHPEERAALAARRPRAAPEGGAPRTVILAMPLVGRDKVRDWSVIETALARTLATVHRQTSPDWIVHICGQDRPESLPDDPRIRFLPFTQAVEGHDKYPKLRALATALPDLGVARGLYMPFDADDLLAPDAVAHMQAAPGGTLAAGGYILNAATGTIAPTARPGLRQPRQRPFWKFCGSCAAFPFDLSDGDADIRLFEALAAHEHRIYPHVARLAGMPMQNSDAALVAYLIDHGENFGVRRGRGRFKTRFVERFAIRDPRERARLQARFGWAPES